MDFRYPEKATDKPLLPARDSDYMETTWGIPKHGGKFEPISVPKPKVQAKDIKIDVHYCGICHTDLHIGCNHLGGATYPIVPGHEIIGLVTEVGAEVTKFKVGDIAGVGFMNDSCMECSSCKKGDESYCRVAAFKCQFNDLNSKYGHNSGNPDQ